MSLANWELMLQQVPISALIAMGLTFVITAGYIDLSVGAIVGLAGLLGALSVNRFGYVGLGLCVVIGLIVGVINGTIFAFFRIPSFVTTLATMVIIRAIVFIIAGGATIYLGNQGGNLGWLGTLGQFPTVVLFTVAIGAILWIIYTKTVFGQNLKAIGGSESVAKLFGVHVELHKILAFGISGLVAGVATIINLAQYSAATPNSGLGLELIGISAVVLGGTPLTGARGSIPKSVVGAFALVVLADGLVLSNVPSNWNDIARGCLLIVAIAIALDRKKVGVVK